MAKRDQRRPKIEFQVSHQKQPKSVLEIDETRQPREGPPVDYMSLKASWRVRRIQMIDPYGFHELSPEELIRLRERLGNLESMTWNEIFVRDKKQNHAIPIDQLPCKIARKWMTDNMPGQLELWTLRITGAERVWGIFSEGAYQVVFWDPCHRIYPSKT